MSISLPRNVAFAYSLVDGDTAIIEVETGSPVEVSHSLTNPFGEGDKLTTIKRGGSVEVTAPGVMRSTGTSVVGIAYPKQPSEPDPHAPPVTPDLPDPPVVPIDPMPEVPVENGGES